MYVNTKLDEKTFHFVKIKSKGGFFYLNNSSEVQHTFISDPVPPLKQSAVFSFRVESGAGHVARCGSHMTAWVFFLKLNCS